MEFRSTARNQLFVLLIVISLLITACEPLVKTAVPIPPTLPSGPAAGWLQIYFTDPAAPHARDYEGGPDEALAAAIEGARLSVDVAAYSLNLWSIRDALLHAHQRGVVVRMVMESDNMDDREVQELIDTGLPILGDQHEGLMHDKFVVIDRSEVWTGSMNYTVGGAYKDNNNLIRIRSVQVAQDYTNEFEEMFTDNLFGPDGEANTPVPSLTIEGTLVEIYFSPDDDVAQHILELLNAAQESIYFIAFSFTSNDIGAAIIERSQAGVAVAGVMDDGQVASNQGTEYDAFLQSGLDVRLDGNEGLMHHKVIIIDRQIVITGSYNFSVSAEDRNDENVVIIDSPEVAVKYIDEFQKVYGLAQQP